ncbi:MAG: response regulator [Anaerolineae bacterium]
MAPLSLVRELRRVLRHLHDPIALRKTPLAEALGTGQREQPTAHLRRMLSDAIEQLRPPDEAPPQSRPWRTYQVLYYRFCEQFTQQQVAMDMGLSIRHLRREETLAVQALADHLWRDPTLRASWQVPDVTSAQRPWSAQPPDAQTPSPEQELHWLQTSMAREAVDAALAVEAAMRLVQPLIVDAGATVKCHLGADLPSLLAQPTILRQALVSVLNSALQCAPGGMVTISGEARSGEVLITVEAQDATSTRPPENLSNERLAMVARLVSLCGGRLQDTTADSEASFWLQVALPTAAQTPVLVIDDNADTLRLLQRYLANSRFRFVGSTDPREALSLAEETMPGVIVLDVMLPHVDGWELLGRLHAHPRLHEVPILVCGILPEEQMALALGAVGLLRKPISRQAFLDALTAATR